MHPRKLLPRADWYFGRTYLAYLGLCFAALLALVAIADLFQRADEFFAYARKTEIGSGPLIAIVFQYYLARAPSMIIQHMLPLIILLAGVITATAASAANEYTALRASGVSVQRALLPMLILALLAGHAVQWGRDLFLPYLLRKSHEIASTVRPRDARPIALVLRDGDMLESISMGHFDHQGYAHNLRIERRKAATFQRGEMAFDLYTARKAALQPRSLVDEDEEDARRSQWNPSPGARFRRFGRWVRGSASDWSKPVPTWVTPAMLERQVLGEAVMTWQDLELLAGEELDVRLEMWRRRSEPWAAALLLLLTLSLVLRRALRGAETSYTQNIIVGILLCGLYYVLRTGLFSLGESEWLPPLLATGLPAVLLAVPGIWLYQRLEG